MKRNLSLTKIKYQDIKASEELVLTYTKQCPTCFLPVKHTVTYKNRNNEALVECNFCCQSHFFSLNPTRKEPILPLIPESIYRKRQTIH